MFVNVNAAKGYQGKAEFGASTKPHYFFGRDSGGTNPARR